MRWKQSCNLSVLIRWEAVAEENCNPGRLPGWCFYSFEKLAVVCNSTILNIKNCALAPHIQKSESMLSCSYFHDKFNKEAVEKMHRLKVPEYFTATVYDAVVLSYSIGNWAQVVSELQNNEHDGVMVIIEF